jgi:hypothetical protein
VIQRTYSLVVRVPDDRADLLDWGVSHLIRSQLTAPIEVVSLAWDKAAEPVAAPNSEGG